jgi:hypothetical protein
MNASTKTNVSKPIVEMRGAWKPLVQCCVCKLYQLRGTWVNKVPHVKPHNVSHTYCPTCAKEVLSELD